MPNPVDLIIAGAGISGLLSALHLRRAHPEWKIVVLEREQRIGGRLRSTREGSWSCGLQGIGADLFDYVVQVMGEEGGTSVADIIKPFSQVGVLSAQKLTSLPSQQLVSAEMARAIGGAAAAREWSHVEEMLKLSESELPPSDQSFSQAWKGDRKSAALVVLEQLAHLWGFPDLNTAPARTLICRAQMFMRGQWSGAWADLLEPVAAKLGESVQITTDAQIMTARYDDKVWTVASTQGSFQAPRLLVAQSPWEAILWLPKDLWPNPLLNLTSKAKAVSLVLLSDRLRQPCSGLPSLLLIPAEEVQVIQEGDQLVFQAPLNYELTVQSPAVVKAVKRLKRAKKKLQTALPALEVSDEAEQIALLSVGWSQAAVPQEQRWFDKVNIEAAQKAHLGFCGDAYGAETDSDRNLIHSVDALRRAWTARG